MIRIKLLPKEFRRNSCINGFLGVYLFMAVIEILAEFSSSTFFVLITKPFLMPLLLLMYLIKRKKPNLTYVVSLVFAWLSNVFFMFTHHQFVLLGTFFSLLFFTSIVYLIYNTIKISDISFFRVNCIPFLLVYIFFIIIAYQQLEQVFYMFILQSFFMILLGAYASSSFILYPNRSNTYLFISVTLFIVSQFVLILKGRISIHFFLPIQTVFYVFAQYVFYVFVVLEEKRKRYYQITNMI